MTDDTASCVFPALSLHYSVHPDGKDARLKFINSYCTINYHKGYWWLTDLNGDSFKYHDLKTALVAGAE